MWAPGRGVPRPPSKRVPPCLGRPGAVAALRLPGHGLDSATLTSLCIPAPQPHAVRRMDIALLVFLILLNALFAMSEMALTASRKARLQVMVEAGDSGARHAMELHDDPTKFLSVVQIGITSIGILNGIVGDAAFSAPFARWLHANFNLGDRAAEISATAMVVITIT